MNKWLYDLAPWKLKETKEEERRSRIIRTLLEGILYLAHVYLPFTPRAANKILSALGAASVPLEELDYHYTNLKPGSDIAAMDRVLFEKLALDAAGASEEEGEGAGPSKVFPLDIRVGEVKEATLVEETLQLLKVDVGDGRTLQVVTRLHASSLERCCEGKKICLLLNVNETTFQGHRSEAMLLCGQQSKPTKAYALLQPPSPAAPGQVILPKGFTAASSLPPIDVRKDFSRLPFKIGDDGVVFYSGSPVMVEQVAIVAHGIAKGSKVV
mmetsp:Transcript_21456/g.71088  ORF Transcript_21456/g.71088 Transcript_21456/m.71088 type:complete len:269 (+) Transcript_21456:1200-2006(+)